MGIVLYGMLIICPVGNYYTTQLTRIPRGSGIVLPLFFYSKRRFTTVLPFC